MRGRRNVMRVDQLFPLTQIIRVESPMDFNHRQFPPRNEVFSRLRQIFPLGRFFRNSISICIFWGGVPVGNKMETINDNLVVDYGDKGFGSWKGWRGLVLWPNSVVRQRKKLLKLLKLLEFYLQTRISLMFKWIQIWSKIFLLGIFSIFLKHKIQSRLYPKQMRRNSFSNEKHFQVTCE